MDELTDRYPSIHVISVRKFSLIRIDDNPTEVMFCYMGPLRKQVWQQSHHLITS